MIVAPLMGMAFLVTVGLTPGDAPGTHIDTPAVAARYKDATLLPLIRAATQCIVHAVTNHRGYEDTLRPSELEELITDAMDACAIPVRTMIDTHDEMYGRGSGEAFFLGPYLDAVPGVVGTQVRAPAD
jgi:hypothetical protein